jgi:hypothetical protein
MMIFPGFFGAIAANLRDWFETQILSGSTDASDQFGWSVAINSIGDTIIIGAWQDERTGQPVGQNEGLAYIFKSSSVGWYQEQTLSGTLATGSSDFFAFSVSLNSFGDRAAVGAYQDENLTGNTNIGLTYIFKSGSSGWIQEQILSGTLASGGGDAFGWTLAMNSVGDRIVIGATGDERTTGASSEGLAYIFVSGTSGWIQEHILSGSLATGSSDNFGKSVAINSLGDRIIIGADQDEIPPSTIDAQGLAYIFKSGSSGWVEEQILSGVFAVDTFDRFGASVSINSIGDVVVVGASQDETTSSLPAQGLAYIFKSGSSGWFQQQILTGSLAGTTDLFASSVSINTSGNILVVGATFDEGIIGSSSVGLAYVFVSSSNGWNETKILSGSLAVNASDNFGKSVAISSNGERIIVGSNQDERLTGSLGEGLAYIFDLKKP